MGVFALTLLLAAAAPAGAHIPSCSFVHCPAVGLDIGRWRHPRLRMASEASGDSPPNAMDSENLDAARAALAHSFSLPPAESAPATEKELPDESNTLSAAVLAANKVKRWNPYNVSYHPINQDYPGLRQIHEHPPLYVVDDFLSPAECQDIIKRATRRHFLPSDSGSPERGRSSKYNLKAVSRSQADVEWKDIPSCAGKVTALTGVLTEDMDVDLQVGRYFATMFFGVHSDAYDLSTEDGRRMVETRGQRYCSVLMYLNDVERGGATWFPRLDIRVQPKMGQALIFFGATMDGTLDPMAVHCSKKAVDTKYIGLALVTRNPFEEE